MRGIGIIGLDHVQITASGETVDAAVRFYRDVLGLEEIDKPAELKARGGAWFRLGALQIHIGVDPAASPGEKRHLCFLVGDLGAARQRFRALGFACEDGIAAEGLERFFVRDPAGNRLEIARRG